MKKSHLIQLNVADVCMEDESKVDRRKNLFTFKLSDIIIFFIKFTHLCKYHFLRQYQYSCFETCVIATFHTKQIFKNACCCIRELSKIIECFWPTKLNLLRAKIYRCLSLEMCGKSFRFSVK